MPDPTVTWEVYDRVVTVREGAVIPVGLRGTVIAVNRTDLRSTDSLTVLYDSKFSVGDHMTRSLDTPAYALLNLSHGWRRMEELQRQGKNVFLPVQPLPHNGSRGAKF